MAGGLYEAAFVGTAPFPVSAIKPVFPACIIFILLNRHKAAYVTMAIGGTIVSLLSPVDTGFLLARWLIVLVCVDAIAERVMTNRSLYAALILVAFARILDSLLIDAVSFMGHYLLERNIYGLPWSMIAETLVADAAIVGLVFVVITLFTRRFLVSVKTADNRYAS